MERCQAQTVMPSTTLVHSNPSRDTIDALLAENPARLILVHCHGGRSRTAFVLKGWVMRRFGWTEEAAHRWLEQRWDRIDRINERFVQILREEWPCCG